MITDSLLLKLKKLLKIASDEDATEIATSPLDPLQCPQCIITSITSQDLTYLRKPVA